MNPNPRSRTSRLIVPVDIRVSLGPHNCPKDLAYQYSFQKHVSAYSAFTAENASSSVTDYEILYGRVYFTVTVITWQVPGIVTCRSSPSWSASLCRPGVSCVSKTSLPSPKWTQEGVPFTIALPLARQS